MATVLRLLLAAILLAGALGKARDMGAAADRLAPHGVPRTARPAVAWGLVLTEAALALLVASGTATVPAAWATAALLLVFALAFLRLRLRGARRAPCGCLGGAAERPTLLVALRALALAGLAVVVALGAPSSGLSGTTGLWVAVGVLAAVVAGLVVLVLALYRQVGVLSLRLGPRAALEIEEEGPPLGTPAPALRGLRRAGRELVAFASPGCRLCAELAPGLRALARGGLAVVEVDEGADHDAFARWRVPGTPYVVAVEDGVVAAKGLVNTLEQVQNVVAAGAERRRAAA